MIVTTALDSLSNYNKNMQKNVSAFRQCLNLNFEGPETLNRLFNDGTTPLSEGNKSYKYITHYLSL